MSVDFNYPFNITADTPAVASQVQDNLDQLLSWIKVNYRQKDDTPLLTVMPTLPGTPTIPSHAATKAYVDGIFPTGAVIQYAGGPTTTVSAGNEPVTVPTGWLVCNGASYSTTGIYQGLFDIIGYRFGGSGASFNIPDFRTRIPVGRTSAVGNFDDVGGTGGVSDSVLPQHSHTGDPHLHSIDHGHADTFTITNGAGTHTHETELQHYVVEERTLAGSGGTTVALGQESGGAWSGTGIRQSASSGGHNHTITGSVTNLSNSDSGPAETFVGTGSAGEAVITEKNYPPYVVINYLIKT